MNEAQQLLEIFRNSVGPRGRHGGSLATRWYETVLPRSKYSPKSLTGKR